MRFLVLIFALLFMGCEEGVTVKTVEGIVTNIEIGGLDDREQGVCVTFEDGRVVVFRLYIHRKDPFVIKKGKYNIFKIHPNSGNVLSVKQK